MPKDENASQLMRRSTDVAGVCREIVIKTALQIQGRKYVRVEGWQSIATAHGCLASSRDVEKIEGGWRAIGEIRRMSDGVVLATAEGFVGMDETKTWAVRPEYACRAMAQTRAISRACRSAFAHVVVMMDAGLSTTPAEEVPDGGFEQSTPPAHQNAPTARPEAKKELFEGIGGPDSSATNTEVRFVDYKVVNSKPDAKKPWTAFFCTFEYANGSRLEAGTFDKKIGESLDVLKGELVSLAYKPGNKEGKFEIITIEPADVMP